MEEKRAKRDKDKERLFCNLVYVALALSIWLWITAQEIVVSACVATSLVRYASKTQRDARQEKGIERESRRKREEDRYTIILFRSDLFLFVIIRGREPI
jgi:hypothetical protein